MWLTKYLNLVELDISTTIYEEMVWKMGCNNVALQYINIFHCKKPFCNTNVLWHGKNVEVHVLHIILHMLHLTTKSYPPYGLVLTHVDVR